MDLDLRGRVANVSLPQSKPLLPVFDAVVNSLQAIEDHPDKLIGMIVVTVIREQQVFGPGTEDPICGFSIEDDGIGFNEENFRSFNTSDSQWKASRGGKGVGRFMWLKAFKKVAVSSVFRDPSGALLERSFAFSLAEGVSGEKIQASSRTNTGSKVLLEGFDPRLAKTCPRRLDTIAEKLIEHCLVFLFDEACPQILLVDNISEPIHVNDLFAEWWQSAIPQTDIPLKDQVLTCRFVRMRSGNLKHRIHYCAHRREVKSESTGLPDLDKKLTDDRGNFFLSTYVSSPFLDGRVNQERTDFQMIDSTEGMGTLLDEEPTMDEMHAAVVNAVREHLADVLDPLQATKIDEITHFVRTAGPQYRHLLKRPQLLQGIAAGLPEEKLELELHRVKVSLEAETLSEVGAVLTSVSSLEQYEAKHAELLEQLTEMNMSDLAKYVVHRKLVLDILRKLLQVKPDEKYSAEAEIHQVLFPMRSTSEEEPFENQNLWILDERLTFHRFLASDKQLQAHEPTGSKSKERPDICVWGNPVAWTDGDLPLAPVTIIELKKPLRNDYSAGSNPIEEVYRYIEDIRGNKRTDHRGRPLQVHPSSPFYVYILADRTPTLVTQAGKDDFLPTPDGLGFFRFHGHYKAYIEIIGYDKLVADAEKRNRFLFQKLGLPATVPSAKG